MAEAEHVADSTVTESAVTEHRSVTEYPLLVGKNMFGRRKIHLKQDLIDRDNVLEALGQAMAVHDKNAAEIRYLWEYYKGRQPILQRVKEIRPEINNRIVVNIANEIVSFKVGYQIGEPILYVSRKAEEDVMDEVNLLNDYMYEEDKPAKDQELVEWSTICGTSYRIVLPNPEAEGDGCPFEMYTSNPMRTGVAYSTELGERPIMGFKFRETDKGREYTVYTETDVFTVRSGAIVAQEPNYWGIIPIFEYPANHARLGAFEIVLPLLDALNNVMSNRMDGVEQQIQAFLKFINCDIDRDGMDAMKEMGAIKIKSVQGQNADVDVVNSELNQEQTQTLKDDIYQNILTICGMPNRNGGTSTSDTGSAVILRDGWEAAESRAKDFEHIFKQSEKKMLELVLRICRELNGSRLRLRYIDMRFTRRNYENIESKSQVLVTMLQNQKIHPKLAFEHCGMFSDAEGAYEMSEKYYEEQMKQWEIEENDALDGANGKLKAASAGGTGGTGNK